VKSAIFFFSLIFVFGVRALTFTRRMDAILLGWTLAGDALIGLLAPVAGGVHGGAADGHHAHRRYSGRPGLVLKPIPVVDEKMAATMLGLVVRFLPVILFQAGEIADAQRARGIERRKNPLIRLMKFTIPCSGVYF
jgi:energy-coupling factor transporter transmembrane protein EcfT